jgi:hypothetical protein
MTVDEWVETLGLIEVSPEQLRAMRYLESNGFRFLVDFGYENAITKAQAHWASR